MDINRIKQRLAEMESSQQGRERTANSELFWKPAPGKNVVRILPYKYRPEFPFLELLFHYEVAGHTLISPTSVDPTAPDPIIEFAAKLRTTRDKEDFKISNKISPKLRIYVPIIVRGEEEKGVKFWGHGQKVYTELLKTIDDPDYADISDIKTGRDITIEYEAPTEKNKYGDTTIRVKPNTSPLLSKDAMDTDEGRACIASIKAMPSIEQIFTIPTYDELKEALDKYLKAGAEAEGESPKEDTPAADSTDAKSTKAKADKKAAAPLDGTQKKKIEADFDDLFSL